MADEEYHDERADDFDDLSLAAFPLMSLSFGVGDTRVVFLSGAEHSTQMAVQGKQQNAR